MARNIYLYAHTRIYVSICENILKSYRISAKYLMLYCPEASSQLHRSRTYTYKFILALLGKLSLCYEVDVLTTFTNPYRMNYSGRTFTQKLFSSV